MTDAGREAGGKHNDPGKFTALYAYEWTSIPNGSSMDRNLFFKDKPAAVPFSSFDSIYPDDTPAKRLAPGVNASGEPGYLVSSAGSTVAWADADKRKPDPNTGKLPPVGNTVDIKNATYTSDIGDTQLTAQWTDPEFDPTVRAAYYVRVPEIPTPRWSTYDAAKLGVEPVKGVPATIQERAWSSPKDTDIVTPNNHTPYSYAWVDLRAEPWDASKLDKEVRDALAAGMKDALAQIKEESTKITDPSKFFRSRKDSKGDYDSRTLGVAVGISGNVKDVSVCFALAKDADGALFDGSKTSYELTFTKDQIPPAKNFWSLTMYKLPQRWLVDNPIKRYSIGSATPGVKTAGNGSLTIHLAANSPGKDKESNWLPAPKGPFWMVLQTYGPGKSVQNGSWKVPPITRAK